MCLYIIYSCVRILIWVLYKLIYIYKLRVKNITPSHKLSTSPQLSKIKPYTKYSELCSLRKQSCKAWERWRFADHPLERPLYKGK